MKKSLLFVAALALGASAAFAQVENPVLPTSATFTPGYNDVDNSEDPFLMDNVNQTITVTFDVTPNIPATVMFATGAGDAIGMEYKRIPVVGNTLTIPLTRADWGYPYNEVYFLNMVVTFTYDVEVDGEIVPDYYLNSEGEPIYFQRMYMAPDTGAARLEKYAPNDSMFDEDFTFANAYQEGNMYVYFSKEVTVPQNVATVKYYDGEDEILSFTAETASAQWSEMDGLYQVVFKYSSDEYVASDISRIEIQLNPVQWENPETQLPESISSPVIVLNNITTVPQAAPRKAKKGVANGLAVGTESVNVYNLQGMLVVKNASNNDIKNLTPGMYIVNGKKIAVK